MRTSRLLALSIVWGTLAAGIVAAACGGDDSSSGNTTPPANPPTPPPNPPPPPGAAPTITAADLTVYTSQTATVDGSMTSAQTFTWTVKSAPTGSSVTSATLGGASTARPTFTADVTGDYVLTLVAANGAQSATKDVTVHAVPAPVFYMSTNSQETPPYFEYRHIGNDGTNGHPIDCRTNGDPDAASGTAGQFAFLAFILADVGEDWWEAPPGQPSHVAFAAFDSLDASNNGSSLHLGTQDSTCLMAPQKVTTVAEDSGSNSGIIQPRFSPNGARVVYIDERSSNNYIASVGYDAKDRRDLAPMCPPGGTSTCFTGITFPPRPQWLNNTTVGWARTRDADGGAAGSNGWEVIVADDNAAPNPRTYMTCDGLMPRSIAFLNNGDVVANRVAPDAGVADLWVLHPSAMGGPCTVVKNLTNLPYSRSYARDFAISPDQNEIAFVQKIDDAGLPDGSFSTFGGQLFTVPANGSAAPSPFGGVNRDVLFGPRYIANASQLAYNGQITDAGQSVDSGGLVEAGIPVITVSYRDGGASRNVAVSDIDGGTFVVGGGNGGACDFGLKLCSVGNSQSAAWGGAFFGLIGLTYILRRRRNR
jgi:hypothetical protein